MTSFPESFEKIVPLHTHTPLRCILYVDQDVKSYGFWPNPDGRIYANQDVGDFNGSSFSETVSPYFE